MQVCPCDVVKSEFRSDEFECARAEVNIERAVVVLAEVESAGGKERSLAAQGSIGVISRRSGGDAVAFRDSSMNTNPLHHRIVPACKKELRDLLGVLFELLCLIVYLQQPV